MSQPDQTPIPSSGTRRSWTFILAILTIISIVVFFRELPSALRWPARTIALAAVSWMLLSSVRSIRGIQPSVKMAAFSAVLILMFYGVLSLLCTTFNRLMSERDERLTADVLTSLGPQHKGNIKAIMAGVGFEKYDREVGWLPRPGHVSADITINSQGVRSLHDYTIPAPNPEKRILCLGDSFTFGQSVFDKETYPYHGEQLRPGTEWVNLGISGACLVQSLLHYRRLGRQFGGKYVVIGFMTDDAKRTVNSFRAFLTPHNPYAKPFAKFSAGKFSLEPNPYQTIEDYGKLLDNEGPEIERLRGIDYLSWSNQVATRNPILRTAEYAYEVLHVQQNLEALLGTTLPKAWSSKKTPIDPYGRETWDESQNQWTAAPPEADPYGQAIWDPRSLGFQALIRVFDLFYSEVLADGRTPLIVIIPGPLDVENFRSGLPRVYETLCQHLEAKKCHYFDFLTPLTNKHRDDLSLKTLYPGRHFPNSINRELAEEVIEALHLP